MSVLQRGVELLPRSAEMLDGIVCHVGTVNVNFEAMAWLSAVARHLPDTPRYFPRGKWATIQSLDAQIAEAAAETAASLSP